MTLPLIVKVGGSLYELPDLGMRLSRWMQQEARDGVLLVPGGGAAADVVRAWDRTHHLGEEASHWLALRMLQVNAHFLARLLPDAPVVSSPLTAERIAILDAFAFADDDEGRPGHLPHAWDVTSDSLAIRVACIANARQVVLLKSVDGNSHDWQAAANAGVVDAQFPQLLRQVGDLHVRIVNLRTWQAAGGPS